MKLTVNNTPIESRHDFTIEVLPDEPITLTGSPQLMDAPGGQAPTVADGSITLHEIGRYRFKVGAEDLHLMCFNEDAVLDFIAPQVRSLGHGGGETDAAKVRSVVRSLCTTTWFDGSLASLTTGEPSRSLAQFGC